MIYDQLISAVESTNSRLSQLEVQLETGRGHSVQPELSNDLLTRRHKLRELIGSVDDIFHARMALIKREAFSEAELAMLKDHSKDEQHVWDVINNADRYVSGLEVEFLQERKLAKERAAVQEERAAVERAKIEQIQANS